MPKFKLTIDEKHVALLLLSTFVGAVVANLQQDVGLADAVMQWSTAKPLLEAALAAGAISVAGQARKSFLEFILPPPPAPPTAVVATIPPPSRLLPPPPPPVQTRVAAAGVKVGRFLLLGPVVALLVACASLGQEAKVIIPDVLPPDLKQDYECVQGQIDQHVTDVLQIEKTCAPGQLATIVKIVDTLVTSGAFGQSHPDDVPKLQRSVAMARVGLGVCPPVSQ